MLQEQLSAATAATAALQAKHAAQQAHWEEVVRNLQVTHCAAPVSRAFRFRSSPAATDLLYSMRFWRPSECWVPFSNASGPRVRTAASNSGCGSTHVQQTPQGESSHVECLKSLTPFVGHLRRASTAASSSSGSRTWRSCSWRWAASARRHSLPTRPPQVWPTFSRSPARHPAVQAPPAQLEAALASAAAQLQGTKAEFDLKQTRLAL